MSLVCSKNSSEAQVSQRHKCKRFADSTEAVERSVHSCQMQDKAQAKVKASQSHKVQIGASGGTNL